jgi:hypothetical protein
MVVGACGSATEPSTPIAGGGSARTAVPRSTAPRGSPKQAGGGGVGTGAARSPKPSAGSDTGGSLFGRHDAPPGSVAQFLDFGTGGGGTCHDDPGPGSPTVNIEQPFPLSVCAYNFIPGESIDLVVRGPRGWRRETHQVANESGHFEWEFDALPSPIKGDYTAEATQQGPPVTGHARVEFGLMSTVVLPSEIRSGQTAYLYVAGGKRSGVLPAYLYREGSGRLEFAATIGAVRLDANGEGRISLRSRKGDPPGRYAVSAGGGDYAEFKLASP